jgi:hypothetical protein
MLFICSTANAAPEQSEWEALAQKGNVTAMVSLGLAYHTGSGVELDYKKAMGWYLLAYAKSDGDSLNNIGVMYRDGLGVAKNEKIAYLLFLRVHMEGLGTEATQIRTNRSLRRLVESLKKEEISEALSYTWEFVDQIVKSRGTNMKPGKNVLPSNNRPRIRDNGWWLDSERKNMDFKSPAPWDKILKEDKLENPSQETDPLKQTEKVNKSE